MMTFPDAFLSRSVFERYYYSEYKEEKTKLAF